MNFKAFKSFALQGETPTAPLLGGFIYGMKFKDDSLLMHLLLDNSTEQESPNVGAIYNWIDLRFVSSAQ